MKNYFKNTLNTIAAAGIAGVMSVSAAHAGPIEQLAQKAPGEFICNSNQSLCAENLRGNGATAFDFERAADHSFKSRVAILVYGGDKNFLNAAFRAAKSLASRGQKTRFVMLPDNDSEPTDAKVEIYFNGLSHDAFKWEAPNPTNQDRFLELQVKITSHGESIVEIASSGADKRQLSSLDLDQ